MLEAREATSAGGLIIIASAAYSFITTILPSIDLSPLSVHFSLPKLPLVWVVIIALAVIAFIAVEGGTRYSMAIKSEMEELVKTTRSKIEKLTWPDDRPKLFFCPLGSGPKRDWTAWQPTRFLFGKRWWGSAGDND